MSVAEYASEVTHCTHKYTAVCHWPGQDRLSLIDRCPHTAHTKHHDICIVEVAEGGAS